MSGCQLSRGVVGGDMKVEGDKDERVRREKRLERICQFGVNVSVADWRYH